MSKNLGKQEDFPSRAYTELTSSGFSIRDYEKPNDSTYRLTVNCDIDGEGMIVINLLYTVGDNYLELEQVVSREGVIETGDSVSDVLNKKVGEQFNVKDVREQIVAYFS